MTAVSLEAMLARRLRVAHSVLPDGTPSFAPVGTVVRDGDRVLCHLCGRWFRSVVAHLRSHGWHHLAYRETIRAIVAECGQPQTWVRRRAGLA